MPRINNVTLIPQQVTKHQGSGLSFTKDQWRGSSLPLKMTTTRAEIAKAGLQRMTATPNRTLPGLMVVRYERKP